MPTLPPINPTAPTTSPNVPDYRKYGYESYDPRTHDEAAAEFAQSEWGRRGNPRNLGLERALQEYGSHEGMLTAISDYDHAWNAAINGSAGDYKGGKRLYRDEWEDLERRNGGAGGGGVLGGGGGGSLSDRVKKLLEERLSGNSQFFGPEATRKSKAGAFETIQRRLRSNNQMAKEDAIDSGQGEGDAYNTTMNANRRDAAETYSGAARDIEQQDRMGAYQAQSDALSAFLEQTRAEAEQAIAREGNAIQRERIAADSRIAERQIQARLEEIGRQMEGERASGRANRDWQDARDERNRQWDLEDWYRNHLPQVPGGL